MANSSRSSSSALHGWPIAGSKRPSASGCTTPTTPTTTPFTTTCAWRPGKKRPSASLGKEMARREGADNKELNQHLVR